MRDYPLALVVDDVEDNRQLYAKYLASSGFRVDGADSGEAALASVAHEKPDVIVMDLAMPGMDGWETTRRIKTNVHTQDIVILVVTGQDTPCSLLRAREAGADDVCIKPCLPQDLLSRIHALLPRARRRAARAAASPARSVRETLEHARTARESLHERVTEARRTIAASRARAKGLKR